MLKFPSRLTNKGAVKYSSYIGIRLGLITLVLTYNNRPSPSSKSTQGYISSLLI